MVRNILIGLGGTVLVAFIVLVGFYLNSYKALEEQTEAMETLGLEGVEIHEDIDEIRFIVTNPKKNIVFLPGGLVEPDAYSYLALGLAKEGYNVTIAKSMFNLAIFTPNRSSRFLSEELDNVVMGHSLGGVTSSLMVSNNDLVDEMIFLASYPISDVTDKEVYFILAELDFDETDERLVDSLQYSNEEEFFVIEGGNHAQFGWYGKQKGDLDAVISTLEQQTIIKEKILEFIG
jgi:pimeloyl-ACP methyl ester carboxylesterase